MAVREGQDRRVDRYPEKLLTLEEASRILGISADDVEAFVRSGKLPAFRLGGTLLRLRFQDVDDLRQSLSPVAGGERKTLAGPTSEEAHASEGWRDASHLKQEPALASGRATTLSRGTRNSQKATEPLPLERMAPPPERIRAPTPSSASPLTPPFVPPAGSPFPSMSAWQRWVEFIAFNDFYIVALLLILTLLAIIMAL